MTQICFKVKPLIRDRLDDLARRRGQTRAELCRNALVEFLEIECIVRERAHDLSKQEQDQMRFGLTEAGFWERLRQEGLRGTD